MYLQFQAVHLTHFQTHREQKSVNVFVDKVIFFIMRYLCGDGKLRLFGRMLLIKNVLFFIRYQKYLVDKSKENHLVEINLLLPIWGLFH